MMARSPAVWEVIAHEPAPLVPVQLSPVLAFTVTVPEGASALAPLGAAEYSIVTGLPASVGVDITLVMTVTVARLTRSP
jgi:hypothetical protein